MLRNVLTITVLVLGLCTHLWAADFTRIGVVDFGQIMERSSDGKAIQKKIQEKGEQLKSELEKAQVEIKALQEKYSQEAPLWSEETRTEKENVFSKKVNDFNLLKMKNEKEFNEFKARLINDVKGDLISAARKKAEKEGYLLIIEKQSGSVVYAHSSISITADLLKELEKGSKAK